MLKTKIEIENKTYVVEVVENQEEAEKGLMGRELLEKNYGMLFPYDEEDEVSFWMKNTSIPLDIIFIDEDGTVTRVTQGKPGDETPIIGIAKDVLELNLGSGVKIGDQVYYEPEDKDVKIKKMLVLGSDGRPQMEIEGGERIFSRKNTATLIRLSKRAYKDQTDSSYKRVGRMIIKYLNKQDGNEPEYVSLPNK
jgi:uncharacterized membrane protein (UPF0127 family)